MLLSLNSSDKDLTLSQDEFLCLLRGNVSICKFINASKSHDHKCQIENLSMSTDLLL